MSNFIDFDMKVVYNNDVELIQSLKNGESKAYSYLLNQYHHKLCVYAYGLTNDYDISEDIVQNVFVYLWKNRVKLKDLFSIKSYLYKSVYNEFIDQYRKKKTVIALEKEYIDALNHVVDTEDENSLERLITLVKQEIEHLPPKCKQTFLLSKKEGLTNMEIAEYLDVSIKSVEAHITKAFSILRQTVGDKMESLLFLLFGITRRSSSTY